jgi:hypothetical protein
VKKIDIYFHHKRRKILKEGISSINNINKMNTINIDNDNFLPYQAAQEN